MPEQKKDSTADILHNFQPFDMRDVFQFQNIKAVYHN